MAWNSKKQSSRTLFQSKSPTQVEIKKKTFVDMPNTYMLQTVTLIFNTVCYPAQCSSVETKCSRLPLGSYKTKAPTLWPPRSIFELPFPCSSKHGKQGITSALLLIDPMKVQSNLDYPDYSIIRTFFSGPNFFMNINQL